MRKNNKKSLLVCAVLVSVLAGGLLPVTTAFADVSCRYQLVKGEEWSSGTAIPYGSVVQKAGDGKYFLYEIRTGNATAWGLVGRGINTPVAEKQITLQYDWHTADATDGINHLVPNTVATGDITVTYDGTKVANERQTTVGDYTVYKEINSSITSDIRGGALCSSETDGQDVKADFIGNSLLISGLPYEVSGGAIYNFKTMGNITGDFIGNYVSSSKSDYSAARGGAIYNLGTIGDIVGDFIGNYATSDYAQSSAWQVRGGAIFNGAVSSGTRIKSITGDFINNYVLTSEIKDKGNPGGGAIYNDSGAEIGSITGNFIGNYVSGSSFVMGGVIFNDGTIDTITGNFYNNYVSGRYAYGGAIVNDGVIGCVTGDFTNNYLSGSDCAHGGAIYNGGTMKVVADRDIKFEGNTVSGSADSKGGAIYNENRSTMSLCAAVGKNISFVGDVNDVNTDSIHNDGILNIGGSQYTGTVELATVTFADDTVGRAEMNINGGKVTASGNITQKTVNLAAGAFLNVMGTLAINNGNFIIETDMTNGSANCVILDKLVLNGNLTISACNVGLSGVADKHIAILTVENGNLSAEKITPVNAFVYNYFFAPTIAVEGNSIYLTGLECIAFTQRYEIDQNSGKVVTGKDADGNDTPWGLVGRGINVAEGEQGTKAFDWSTEGNITKLVEHQGEGTGDINVVYDKTKAYINKSKGSDGGAIYNDHGAKIGDITGDFIGNSVVTPGQDAHAYGGAIYNGYNVVMGDVMGDFIGNSIVISKDKFRVCGSAIYNDYGAKIGNIIGDFIGNSIVISGLRSDVHGGAIYNHSYAQMGNVVGDFIGNSVVASGEYYSRTGGGAISNSYSAKISNVTGDFIGNFVVTSGSYTSAFGGAIHNDHGEITITDSNFFSNYASGTFRSQGGAICNRDKGTVTIRAESEDVVFKDNRVVGRIGDGGAICNERDATVNLYASAGKSITFEGDDTNHSIDSIYNVGILNINGKVDTTTYTGTVKLANVDGNGAMNINGGTVIAKASGLHVGGGINVAEGAILSLNDGTLTSNVKGEGTLEIAGNVSAMTNHIDANNSIVVDTGKTLNLTGGDLKGHRVRVDGTLKLTGAYTVDCSTLNGAAALNITSGSNNVNVDSSSTLILKNAPLGNYTVIDGSDAGWAVSKINAGVLRKVSIDNTTDNKFTLTMEKQSLEADKVDMADIVSDTYLESPVEQWLMEVDGTYAGWEEFVYSVINTVANMSAVAGVQSGTASMVNSMANNIASNIGSSARPNMIADRGGLRNTAADNAEVKIETVANGKANEVMPARYAEKAYGKEVWASYIHSKQHIDGLKAGSLSNKSTMQYNGVTVGADLWSGRHSFGGVALSYADGNTNAGNLRNDTDYYGVSIYNRHDYKGLTMLTDVSYTHSKNDINISGVQEITADAKADAIGVGVRFETPVTMGKTTVTPYAGARYTYLKNKDYKNSLDMEYDTDNQNLVTIPVGLEISAEFAMPKSDWTFRPVLEGGYVWNLGDRDGNTKIGYMGAYDIVGFETSDPGQYFIRAAMQFAKADFTCEVGYRYSKGKSVRDNRWNVNLNFSF
ncbi:MAG: autotransporter domain-containing protein [Acidaminococcaceae bacterium]|nr:autotransporter domain-containing protein [Acidaminococcaceae bacterium]